MKSTVLSPSVTEDDEPTIPLAPILDMLRLFAKAVRAHQLYLPNNPMHVRAFEAVRGGFKRLWDHTDSVTLQIAETQFMFEGHLVLEELGRSSDSLPWVFYKDGVRSLELCAGVEGEELRALINIVHRARSRVAEDDDLLTLLWEYEFEHLRYQYIELAPEGSVASSAILVGGETPTGTINPPGQVEQRSGDSASLASSSPFARMEDFDTTLYFLEPQEVEYLHSAIRDAFETDMRPAVLSAILDTLELESRTSVRDELCDILEQWLLVLIAHSQFHPAALLLREVSSTIAEVRDLGPDHRERLLNLAAHMSQPDVLLQLLQALEECDIVTHQRDLEHLFAQLRPQALAILMTRLARSENTVLRPLLEHAVVRLAQSHTAELVKLIGSEDQTVSLEAVRQAGALRSPVAVNPLARILLDGDGTLRKAAALALIDIGSPGAMQALEPAVDDTDRDIRVATVRAMANRQHRAALARIERTIKEQVLQNSSNTAEKTVFFDAYGTLAGDRAIPLLDGILNPKGFLTRKEDPQTRACAAATLARIGTPSAVDALQRATSDKEVVVRTAANRALRGAL